MIPVILAIHIITTPPTPPPHPIKTVTVNVQPIKLASVTDGIPDSLISPKVEPTVSDLTTPNQITKEVNQVRTDNGLNELYESKALDLIATKRAEYLFSTGIMSHDNYFVSFKDNWITGWCGVGEVLSLAYTQDQVVSAWLNSPSHKAELLGDYDYTGSAVISGYWNGSPTPIIVETFSNKC